MSITAGVRSLRLKFPGSEGLTFRDLDIAVKTGEKVLLLGPSGCGKSTLLQVLSGLIPGAIEIPLKANLIVKPDRWAFVFQDPDTQFCMPYVDEELAFVLENMQVPRDEMQRRMELVLGQVGLHFNHLHTLIASLSQGMKQRLAIACALALEPEVLFLDEPTALLDPEGTKRVWETIRTAAADKTVIIVEHKIEEIIDYIDRVVLFNRSGEIMADGPKDAVFAAHKDSLIEGGIWYPGVWTDFAKSGKSPERPLPAAADRRTDIHPILRLKDFTAYRGKEPRVCVGNAEVRKSEWIAVVGQNGAGKSTLLLGLMQLVKTGGSYELNGAGVLRKRVLSDEIAFVFQNPEFQFVTNSVYDEIAFSLRQEHRPESEVDHKVIGLLADFDLEARKEGHPYQLSLGQKRRLSVASAIVKDQPLLLLDEPTFGQDAKNTFALLERLEKRRLEGTAIMMVTHDPELVRTHATRVWVIDQGKLLADMEPRDWYDAYERQARSGVGEKEPIACK